MALGKGGLALLDDLAGSKEQPLRIGLIGSQVGLLAAELPQFFVDGPNSLVPPTVNLGWESSPDLHS